MGQYNKGYIELTSLQVIAMERELLKREGKYLPSTTEEQRRKLNKEAKEALPCTLETR